MEFSQRAVHGGDLQQVSKGVHGHKSVLVGDLQQLSEVDNVHKPFSVVEHQPVSEKCDGYTVVDRGDKYSLSQLDQPRDSSGHDTAWKDLYLAGAVFEAEGPYYATDEMHDLAIQGRLYDASDGDVHAVSQALPVSDRRDEHGSKNDLHKASAGQHGYILSRYWRA